MPTNLRKITELVVRGDTKNAESALGRLNTGMSGLQRAAGALGVALSAGAFVGFVKSSLNAVDALAKTSDKLGVTTEALAGLRHAAELTGVSSGTLDMALQRMTRRLAEAAQGTGEAKSALVELGLNAKQLANLSPDQAFAEIASAMENVTNQSDRVRLAFKLFDSEGVALVNTLGLGKQGLEDMRKEAEKFGLAIDREAARKAEEANDAMKRLEASARGLGQEVAISLAPSIEDFANLLSDNSFQEGLRGTVDLIGKMANAVLDLAGAYMQATNRAKVWSEAYAKGDIGFLEWVFGDAADVENYMAGQQMRIGFGSDIKPNKSATENPYKYSPSAGSKASTNKPGLMGSYGDGLWEMQAKERWEVHSRGLDYMIANEEEKGQRLVEIGTDNMDELSQFTIQAYRDMQQAGSDFFQQLMDGNLDSFESFVGSFEQMLNRMVANYLSQMAMMKMFGDMGSTGDLGGWIGNAIGIASTWAQGGSGAVAGATTLSTGAIINPSGAVFKMHSGGVVPGYPGQEVPAILQAGETVIPAGKGAGVNISMTVVTNDAESFKSPQSQAQVMAAYKQAMERASRRNN